MVITRHATIATVMSHARTGMICLFSSHEVNFDLVPLSASECINNC